MQFRYASHLAVCLLASFLWAEAVLGDLRGAPAIPTIVILNSYHQGEVWSDNEIAGILPVLRARYPHLIPSIEHLDTKRFPSSEHLARMREHLWLKYRNRPAVDLVMVLDNPALDLVLHQGKDLFAGVPVVFAGINGFCPELTAGRASITGVAENLDMAGTLKMALGLHPGAKVLAVHDYTASGLAVRREMEEILPQFEGKADIVFSPDGRFEDLARKLKGMSADGLVLLLTYVTDQSDRTFTREESTRMISSLSPAPVYAMHETRLGYGIVGGMLLEGKEHGKQAAEMAIKILAGGDPSLIPVERSRSRPVLDYRVLSHFRIPEKIWPADAVVINRPLSLWQRHGSVLLPASIVIAVLVLLVTLLSIMVRRKRRAEEDLQREKTILKDILEDTLAGYWDWDIPTGREYLSPTLKRMFGYEDHELPNLAETWQRLIFAEDLPGVLEFFDRHVASHGIFPYYNEVRYRHKSGSTVWVICAGRVIEWDEKGGPIRMVGCHIDITERKRAEQALRDTLRTSDDIVRTIPSGLFIYQYIPPDRLILISGNPEAERLTGIRSEDWKGREFNEIWPEAKQSGVTDSFLEVMRTGNTFETEDLRYADKRLAGAFRIRAFALPENRLAVAFENVTAQKRAVEEREKLQEQLNQSQKMESVGRLAGGVAHDFNNMLGVILGHTELTLAQVDPAQPLFAGLQEIRKAAERSANLTRQLLAFARKQTVAPKVLDLNETVEGMLRMLRRLIGEDIVLVLLPGADLWPVKVDPSQIDQILANLCVNARDAIEGVGNLTIETGNFALDEAYCREHAGFTPGEYVLLAVSDDGCGMSKEVLDNLFEPFFTTKGVGEGTGLGLSTVYGIVKQNDGLINVYSEPGKGTTFRIYLPRHADKAAQIQKESPAEPAGRGHETILLVEDEPAILKMARMMLEHLGYRVLAAGTPGEAIRVAEDHAGRIHLLMTDVVMPEMNGRDLAANLLALHPNFKRLFMSGYLANIIAHHGVLDEGLHFIQKPFSMQDLAAKVREVLDSRI